MLALIVIVAYYAFFLEIAISGKDSLINTMQAHGLTTITVNVKEFVFNSTTNQSYWIEKPKSIDLVGFIDFIMTVVIVFAPLIIVVRWLWP
jgi:hypothetical protein